MKKIMKNNEYNYSPT